MSEQETSPPEKSTSSEPMPRAFSGLSAKLLVLTIFFVMVAEFLIYTPSISRFRKDYLEEHIAMAHLASLALEATPDNMVNRELEEELLYHAEAYSITLKHPTRRVLMLSTTTLPDIDVTFDMRQGNFRMWIVDAFAVLFRHDNRVMQVIGVSPKAMDVIVEVTLDEAPMREAMLNFSSRILQLSIVISLLTAGLVYFTLLWLMVRPLRRITLSMVRFREDPEDDTRQLPPSKRNDEIGVALRELALMKEDVRAAFNQKNRLATLGAAVAKINHDLRNSLSTAMLVSDRLADIDDPEVKKVTPRLYTAIDKAVVLCSQTLNYVSGGTQNLQISHFHLHELISEVAAAMRDEMTVGVGNPAFSVINEVDFEIDLQADRELLFRAFSNLTLNARQVGASQVTVRAQEKEPSIIINVTDNGPGLTENARKKLFQPFASSSRDGGTGLGLVIVRDIVGAHGGDITLVSAADEETTFRLAIPKQAS
ncbi:MAG: HAMP domain-containing histidine kinase [Rhodospirillales bacterium]|nr:HAMP domain-containing histidine kinase [Rhodospirillales bacterium]